LELKNMLRHLPSAKVEKIGKQIIFNPNIVKNSLWVALPPRTVDCWTEKYFLILKSHLF